MIAGTGYIKSANDELLARDEGGGSNLFMEVQNHTRASIAHDAGNGNFFFPSVDAAARRNRRALKGSTCEPTIFKLQ